MGAHAVELDVRRSADGVLVVHHDAHLSDGRTLVEVEASELPRDVPTLGAALDACEGMWVNVEIKNDPGDPDFDAERTLAGDTVQLLQGRPDPATRWVISSFDRRMIDEVHGIWPEAGTAWITLDASPAEIADVAAAGHTALHPDEAYVTEHMVRSCHAAGLALNTWTCDDPDRMAQLARFGVDGICTNVPDVALSVMRGLEADGA
jgi:glycerophosphoryl diester phosphodiesterase